MSTAQGITQAAPRLRIGLRAGLVALGVLVAVAVTAVIVAFSGGSRTSGAVPTAHYAAPTGARIDHRGLRASSVTSASARHPNCVFVRPEHRCIAP
jgi:hypothetical protein